MKTNTRRLTAALLSLLAVGSTAVSCGTAADSNDNDTAALPVTTGGDSAAVTATETQYPDPVLPDVNYEGTTFTFLTSGPEDQNGAAWQTYDIYAAEADGDTITDAVYARNMWIEEKLNVHIAEIKSDGYTLDIAKKAVTAGETTYDAIMTSLYNACMLGQEGYLYDILSIPNLNLEEDWWDQRQIEDMTIAGKLYIATGDITVLDNDATWVLMFGKQLANDLDLPSLYDLVREDQWTLDKMYDMAKSATRDVNGDGKIYGWDDIYGLLTTADTAPGLLYASGYKLSSRDTDGYPMLDIDTLAVANVVEQAGALMGDRKITLLAGQDDTKSTDDVRIFFQEGRGLFFGEVLQCVTRMRESTTDFGLLPWPKYDETQENYHNFIHATAGKGVTVPATQNDLEKTGVILEAMAAKSVSTVTKAYYDVALTYKYMRDEESAEMLDIILDSRIYDLTYLYNWATIFTEVTTLIQNGKNTFTSTWEAKLKAASKYCQRTVEAYQDNT